MPWDATLAMLGFALFISVTIPAILSFAVYRFERKYGKAGQTGAPPPSS
ncbi:hypothetical protein [Methylobacterium frigidaeris]|uniref:Uncharacterized protein n=1 Tax=Methylobacterium frigidaeris TaxID=2038277 RepID=A0AA37HBZ7_9HYPH|nr:hypothetical protein [Methylobacterium frigidaeris]GJD63044.1 hypothetical protein MPEAHAMD_3205 [Methylobacterium frigidaeris]